MKEVQLAQRDSLYEPHKRCKYVYFPETGVGSILTVLKDGTETEVATVGFEGVVGLPAFFGAPTGPRRASCQIAGTALRVDAASVQRETRKKSPLSKALHLYSQALFTYLAQMATCNRRHTIKQRFCCWLLFTHDRVQGDELDLTQEFLAQTLGVRRAGITVIAGSLQRAGAIRYHHGRITIRSRRVLQKAACECYQTVRSEFERLLG